MAPKRTPEEVREGLELLGEIITAEVEAIQSSADFMKWLRTGAAFHQYSIQNTMLIMLQMPTATRCASFTTWLKLGRAVRKGEHGISIYAPRHSKHRVDEETGERKGGGMRGFTIVKTFDISQTDGDDLPSMQQYHAEGGDEQLLGELLLVADALGAHADIHPPNSVSRMQGYNGYYNRDTHVIIVVERAVPDMIRTLCHEIGHHLDPRLLQDGQQERETVAEAVAYAVMDALGLDTSAISFRYIAAWLTGTDAGAIIARVLHRAQEITRTILSELDSVRASFLGDSPMTKVRFKVTAIVNGKTYTATTKLPLRDVRLRDEMSSEFIALADAIDDAAANSLARDETSHPAAPPLAPLERPTLTLPAEPEIASPTMVDFTQGGTVKPLPKSKRKPASTTGNTALAAEPEPVVTIGKLGPSALNAENRNGAKVLSQRASDDEVNGMLFGPIRDTDYITLPEPEVVVTIPHLDGAATEVITLAQGAPALPGTVQSEHGPEVVAPLASPAKPLTPLERLALTKARMQEKGMLKK